MLYLLYKIINNSIFFIWKKKHKTPLLEYRDIVCEGKCFHFDFNSKTTHLGDRLFFLPLLKGMHEKGIKFKVSDRNNITELLFISLYGHKFNQSNFNDCINVIPKPSFIKFFSKYNNLLVCDFTDVTTKNKITHQLIESFNFLFKLDLKAENFFIESKNFYFDHPKLLKSERYVIFNNYIDSGSFRLLFLNKKRLINKAISLKNKGYRIIHLGSKKDFDNDSFFYNFVDVDLRSVLTLEEVVCLVKSPNVFGIVTYDNFFMHLGNFFNKDTWVLFRGRFTKSQYFHHLNKVNNTFLQKELTVNYL